MNLLINFFSADLHNSIKSFDSALDQSIAKRLQQWVAKYSIAMPWNPATGFTMVMLFLQSLLLG
jgi:hypothetical protein